MMNMFNHEYERTAFFKYFPVALLLFFLSFNVQSRASSFNETGDMAAKGDVLEISLGEAIIMALGNNKALQVERYNPRIMKTYEEGERSVFDPFLSAGIASSRERVNAESRTTGIKEDTTSGRGSAGAGVSKLLPTGTELSAGLDFVKDWSDLYSDQYSTRLGFSVTQALLRGAGLDFNLAKIRQARLDTLSSAQELRGFAESLVAEIETTYWNYALAARQMEIYVQSLGLAEQQLTETQERISAGSIAEIELAAAQAEVALRKESLIEAKSNLETLRLRMLRLLNLPGGSSWSRGIKTINEPAVPDVKLDSADVHSDLALRMRPDLNQARLGVERGELEIVRTKNGLLPRMDFFISLGKTGYSDSFFRSAGDISGRSYDISAGLTFGWPVGNRQATSEHKRALLLRDRSEEALENLCQLVEFDVRSAYIRVERFYQQISATAVTREFQEEKLRAETEKFRVGRSTGILVAQAQRDLLDSRISEVEAVVNYLNSMVELFRLEGTLLERRGISTVSI